MQITYKNKKIKKICTQNHVATKQYGEKMSERIQQRIDELAAADSVEEMIKYKIGRCHPLSGNREGQYAVDLVHPYRLVFRKEIVDRTTVLIIEIVDYH